DRSGMPGFWQALVAVVHAHRVRGGARAAARDRQLRRIWTAPARIGHGDRGRRSRAVDGAASLRPGAASARPITVSTTSVNSERSNQKRFGQVATSEFDRREIPERRPLAVSAGISARGTGGDAERSEKIRGARTPIT